MITAGLDIGSLFTKAVIMRGDEVVASGMVRTSGDISQQAHALIRDVLIRGGIERTRVECLGVTGAGAEAIKDADFSEDLLACLGAVAAFYLPDVRYVIDIGGQSMTSLQVNEDGEVIVFLRNDKCASGSGRLLEVMSQKLKLDISEIDSATSSAAEPMEISSQCGVFAESEVITHVNNGESVGAVMAGVCSSVARMAAAQGRKSNVRGRFTVTGGVAKIKSVTRIVQEKLGEELCPFPADPQLAAAIGAALLGDQ
jgi:predicted CoA-substrate-specific enzyme activase